jgi:hypothetical protein
MKAAGSQIELERHLRGLRNNLHTVHDVDHQVEDRHTPLQASLLYHTDCRRDPFESLGAAAGCSGNLGCLRLLTEPALTEALTSLGDDLSLDGPGRHLCEAHIRGPRELSTEACSWRPLHSRPFANSVGWYP